MSKPDTSHYDGLPFPADWEMFLAIKSRIETGCPEAAIGLIAQYRERLLFHQASRLEARRISGDPVAQVRHLKNGSTYEVVAEEALFQVSTEDHDVAEFGFHGGRLVFDGTPVNVYRNTEGLTFVRFPDEMGPDRFETVA